MKRTLTFLAAPALLLCGLVPATAQYGNGYNNQQFYNGVRQGGYGGGYDHDRQPPPRRPLRHSATTTTITRAASVPAKARSLAPVVARFSALSLVAASRAPSSAEAAGAGIGAVVGKEHQNNVRRNDGYYR